MGGDAAVKLAIDLLRVPSRVRPVRAAELPEDVGTLLEIAAGDAEATRRAAEHAGRSPEVVREAATFFIEQVLLAPDADSYRVLGASPEATSGELRRNMALLLRWLHPDMEHHGNGASNHSVFAGRVTLAWDDLKTAERRAAYDAMRQGGTGKASSRGGRSSSGRGRSGRRQQSGQGRSAPRPQRGGLIGALLALFGVARN